MILEADWQEVKTGSFKVWYDNEVAVDKRKIATTMKADQRPYDLRIGLYANDWYNHNNHMRGSRQGAKSILIDRIAIGESFDSVDPNFWAKEQQELLWAAEKEERADEERRQELKEAEEEAKERKEKKEERYKKWKNEQNEEHEN